MAETPPLTVKLHRIYNVKETDAIRKGVATQPVRKEPVIHDLGEQPGVRDPVNILRDYRMF